MRIFFRRLLALVVLFAAPSAAYAYVQINIDLSSQTMTVHSGSGETYVWPISSGGPAIRRRAASSTRARSTRWFIPPNTTMRRCRTPSSSMANMPFTARLPWAILGGRRRTVASGFRPATRRRSLPWCSGKARKSASSDLRSAMSRAASGAPRPRSLLRRSAIRGRSINGRAIRWRAERGRALIASALITRHQRRNSRAWVSRFPSV